MTEYIGDPERCMRQEAERRNAQLKKHLADARRVAGLWYNRAKAKPVEAEELAATAQREEELIRIRWALRDVRSANRSLAQQLTDRTSNRDYWHDTCLAAEKERTEIRQEAQAQSDEVQAHWLSPCEAEELRRQLAQAVVAQADAELIAHDRDKICYEERRLRLEAEQGHRGALTMAQNRAIRLEQAEHRVEIMAVRARRNQFNTPTSAEALSADRQALAALVTPELAELLERLARYVDTWGDWDTCNADTDAAHDLAAQIRETLEVNDEN